MLLILSSLLYSASQDVTVGEILALSDSSLELFTDIIGTANVSVISSSSNLLLANVNLLQTILIEGTTSAYISKSISKVFNSNVPSSCLLIPNAVVYTTVSTTTSASVVFNAILSKELTTAISNSTTNLAINANTSIGINASSIGSAYIVPNGIATRYLQVSSNSYAFIDDEIWANIYTNVNTSNILNPIGILVVPSISSTSNSSNSIITNISGTAYIDTTSISLGILNSNASASCIIEASSVTTLRLIPSVFLLCDVYEIKKTLTNIRKSKNMLLADEPEISISYLSNNSIHSIDGLITI